MTTGSWSTYRTTTVSTACSSSSTVRNGTTVTWSGGDSPKRVGVKRTFRERLAIFLKDPRILPNGKPAPLKIDPAATARKGAPSTIFDAAREKRIRVYDEPPAATDEYGTPNAYSKTWTTYRETVFPWYYANGTYAGTGTISNCGFAYAGELDGSIFTADHDYKLLSRLRSKVVGSEFNLASFLGAEGLDTLRFLTDTASRIYQSAKAVRKLDFVQAHKVLSEWGRYRYSPSLAGKRRREQEDIYRSLLEAASGKNRGQGWWSVPASTWLEWHLAVEPLLGDVVAAAEQLAHITQMPRELRIAASVTVKKEFTPSLVYTGTVWSGRRTYRKRVIAYFTHAPEPTSFLGLQDPEVTLWNALPLSFVSDYFYNIGGFLEARAIAKALPAGLYVTTVKDETVLTSCNYRKFQGNGNSYIAPSHRASQGYIRGSLTRSLSTTLSVPRPDVKPLGAFSNWQRAATVASLIAAFSDRHAGSARRLIATGY